MKYTQQEVKQPEEKLPYGTIVKVSGPFLQYNHLGMIVGFDPSNPERPQRVWFGRECDWSNSWHNDYVIKLQKTYEDGAIPPTEEQQAANIRVHNYSAKYLAIVPEGWTVWVLAERHFKQSHWSCRKIEKMFEPGKNACSLKDCPNKTSQRIVVNIGSVVHEVDACKEHAQEWHLKRTESLPLKD
ncbi:MAG: hypothetical protein WCF94_03705 [bacterium]